MSWMFFWIYLIRVNRKSNKRRERAKKRKTKKSVKKSTNNIEMRVQDDVEAGPSNEAYDEVDGIYVPQHQNIEKCKDMEIDNGDDSENDDDDDDDRPQIVLKRPTAYILMMIWSYLETIILLYLLIARNKNSSLAENFLHGFCSYKKCKNTMKYSIGYKIGASVLMAIGSHTVCYSQLIASQFNLNSRDTFNLQEITALFLPWFVFTVAGIIPLNSLIVSSFCKCKHIFILIPFILVFKSFWSHFLDEDFREIMTSSAGLKWIYDILYGWIVMRSSMSDAHFYFIAIFLKSTTLEYRLVHVVLSFYFELNIHFLI